MTEPKQETVPELSIDVSYVNNKHGRLARVFRLTDRQGHTLVLRNQDAVYLAKSILRIVNDQRGKEE